MRRVSLPCGCQEVTILGGVPTIAQHCDRHRQELPVTQACGCIVTRKLGHTHTKQCGVHRDQAARETVGTSPAIRAGIVPKPDWDDL